MEITSNYDVTRLFVSKEIKISVNSNQEFTVIAMSVKEFLTNDKWNMAFQLWRLNVEKWKKLTGLDFEEEFEYIRQIIFDLGQFKQYNSVATTMKEILLYICPQTEFDYINKVIKINGITITAEIWNYLIYVVKLYSGDKVNEPLTFNSPEAKAFWLKQQALEEKINKVRANASKDKDGILKAILAVNYSFPGLSFDYLFEQTVAQIHWLRKYAAGAVSYEVNAKAFAAGNVKKGKKLDFFIK